MYEVAGAFRALGQIYVDTSGMTFYGLYIYIYIAWDPQKIMEMAKDLI